MACFLVGGGEAIIGTAVRAVVKKKEMEQASSTNTGTSSPTPPKVASAGPAKLDGCSTCYGAA